MNNGDMPAMPHTAWDSDVDQLISQCDGLTKREYFAGLVLQGLAVDPQPDVSLKEYASMSVRMADALLAALEEQNQ